VRRLILLIPLVALLGGLLAACGGGSGTSDQAPKAVEAYLQALVSQNADKLANLSCKDWEKNATMELDSFQAVSATLEGLTCKQSGSEGNNILVTCQGKIVATYNNEKQDLDLSGRTYKVAQEGGEWRVCGYR
jgi:galactitol-specific phosphotransferase system IIB component